MQKLDSITYCLQHKQPNAKRQSHMSFIEIAVTGVLKPFKTKWQFQNSFHADNFNPKVSCPHKQGNKPPKSYIYVTYFLLVLIYLTLSAAHQKIILQIGNITSWQDASNFRPHHVVLAN